MADKKITHLLIDTSYLFKFGPAFKHPDFMKLLHYSAVDGTVKIYIPHIVWEERRTQLLEDAYARAKDLRSAFDKLNKEISTNIVLHGVTPPTLHFRSDSEIDAFSKEAMKTFAANHKIEVLSLAPDHASRAWDRYFNAEPPFDREEKKREHRRKDMPDSWIFEAVVDLARKYPDLIALVSDGRLSSALKAEGIRVVPEHTVVLEEIEASNPLELLEDILKIQDSISVAIMLLLWPTTMCHELSD